ncbi:MAG: RNA-binding cell elongation regulator Jag/EloR [Vulcanibacillus sp.]
MEKIVATGKTVKEAVYSALKQLETTSDKVDIKIINQPSKRLFGLMGTSEAVVQVELLPEKVDAVEDALLFLKKVFRSMNLVVQLEHYEKDDHILINFIGQDLGVLIGRRGETLDSLQYLVNIVANKNKNEGRVRIVLDAENYRKRRRETLESLADKLAYNVIKTGKEVILEPMTPLERKIIHSRLQDSSNVVTKSQGEEPYRKVVISKK